MNTNSPSRFSDQYPQFIEEYEKIFTILEKFISSQKSNQLTSRNKIFLDKTSIALMTIPLLLLIYSLIIISFKNFNINNKLALELISYSFLVIIVVLAIIALRQLIIDVRQQSKGIAQKLIRKTREKGLHDRKMSEKLSCFSNSVLKYTEIRLKLLIESKDQNDQRLVNMIPFMSLILATFFIYLSGISDFTLSNIMLISGATVILLKGYAESIDDPSLYKRCLSIVEYAQILADETLVIAQHNSPYTKTDNHNLMKALRQYKIDEPSDFEHNL